MVLFTGCLGPGVEEATDRDSPSQDLGSKGTGSEPASESDPKDPRLDDQPPPRIEVSVRGPTLFREADGYAGTVGTFTFQAQVDPTPARVQWVLPQGEFEGEEVSVAFEAPGDYPIVARASDGANRTDTEEFVIRIPARDTHWFTGSARGGWKVQDALVVILPPVYASPGLAANLSWVGPPPMCSHPAVQAALEATEYWRWLIAEHVSQYPQFNPIRWETKTFGCDAGMAELNAADMKIAIAMVAANVPAFPVYQFFGLACSQETPALNIGIQLNTDQPYDVRNTVLHEFGHCLGVGHTGDHTTGHCSYRYGCFDNHPNDVMSQGPSALRRCLSNLNVLSLAESHGTGYDGEAFMLRTNHRHLCMPNSLARF